MTMLVTLMRVVRVVGGCRQGGGRRQGGKSLKSTKYSQGGYEMKTLPKAQRTRGLSSSFQSDLLGHITSSNTNLDQTSSSKSRPSI